METKQKTVDLPPQKIYTRDDYFLDALKDLREAIRDLKDGQKELHEEIKEVRAEIKDVRTEIKEVRTELNGRCDKIEGDIKDIRNEMRAMLRHSQILTASVAGLAIAIIFSLLK